MQRISAGRASTSLAARSRRALSWATLRGAKLVQDVMLPTVLLAASLEVVLTVPSEVDACIERLAKPLRTNYNAHRRQASFSKDATQTESAQALIQPE